LGYAADRQTNRQTEDTERPTDIVGMGNEHVFAKMTSYVSSETLNSTYSLIHSGKHEY